MNDPALVLSLFLAAMVLLLVAALLVNYGKRAEQASDLFEKWRKAHLDDTRANLREEERLKSERWRNETEQKIREDARTRSDSTHYGKITEHLVPWLADADFDPRDMRFIGSPVDFVVFDGLADGGVVTVTFIEVKSGLNPRLSAREQRVRNAIEEGRVEYRLLKVKRPAGPPSQKN